MTQQWREPALLNIHRSLSMFSLILVSSWFLAGAIAFAGQLSRTDLGFLPRDRFIEIALGAMLMAGSAMVIVSTLRWVYESSSWRLEFVGWPLLVAAWILFTFDAGLHQSGTFHVILGIAAASASARRFWEVVQLSRETRRNMKKLSRITESG